MLRQVHHSTPPGYRDGPGIEVKLAQNQAKQCGFAGAVASKQPDASSFRDQQALVFNDGLGAKSKMSLVETYHGSKLSRFNAGDNSAESSSPPGWSWTSVVWQKKRPAPEMETGQWNVGWGR